MHTQNKLIYLLFFVAFYTPTIIASEIIGITKPFHDVDLSVPVDGIISKVLVKEGQHVKKGDELIRLDDRLYIQELNRRFVILKDTSRLITSQHNKEILKTLVDNTSKVYSNTGSVSEEELKKLKMQYESLAGENNAQAADEKREEVEYNIAKGELEQRILRSPIDGIIAYMDVEAGEWAAAGKMLIRVVDTSKSYLEVNINTEQFYKQNLKLSSKVDIEFNKEILLKKQGTVIFISPVVDTSSSLVRINIEFDNKDGSIKPGISAKLLLPENADAEKGK